MERGSCVPPHHWLERPVGLAREMVGRYRVEEAVSVVVEV